MKHPLLPFAIAAVHFCRFSEPSGSFSPHLYHDAIEYRGFMRQPQTSPNSLFVNTGARSWKYGYTQELYYSSRHALAAANGQGPTFKSTTVEGGGCKSEPGQQPLQVQTPVHQQSFVDEWRKTLWK